MQNNPFNKQAQILPTQRGQMSPGGGGLPFPPVQTGPSTTHITIGLLAKLLAGSLTLSPKLRHEVIGIVQDGIKGLGSITGLDGSGRDK